MYGQRSPQGPDPGLPHRDLRRPEHLTPNSKLLGVHLSSLPGSLVYDFTIPATDIGGGTTKARRARRGRGAPPLEGSSLMVGSRRRQDWVC
jgi:hypothetical protein